MKRYDVIIIGGGIVGLSVAYQIQKKNPSQQILLLEKENSVAQHQTGHNSGVIHSGIYYKPNSAKALNCVRGRQALTEFCQTYDIPFDNCGKLILATKNSEIPILKNIQKRGIANGLENIEWLSSESIADYEPHAEGKAALWVPQTGIVDYLAMSQKLLALIQEKEAEVKFKSKVISLRTRTGYAEVHTRQEFYEGKQVINCAGLYSDVLAKKVSKQKLDFQIIPFRGEYYELKKERRYLVKNLIYPVPDPNFPFLGVHLTRRINGMIEAGPNAVLALKREGYEKTDISLSELAETLRWSGFQKVARKYWRMGLMESVRSWSKKLFADSLAKLVPEIQAKDLVASGAGVRAQVCTNQGELIDDFLIIKETPFVHVCNAPSPAATACLAIAETIVKEYLED